jgi:hypothetical protein
LGIGAKCGDYTQVGDGVQRALVSSPHQSRSGTYQIYLHPLAYPLLWNHRFPFLPRQLNAQHSTLTVALGTLYVPINSRGSIRDETPSRRVADKTKMIANRIEARVVRDTVTENGAPVEMTDDWYAQDKAGNIWYLGEYVTNYNNGRVIGAQSIYVLAALAPSWVRAGWRSDDRCDHPPNRRAERAFALAATSSRSLGGAVVSSEASKCSEILAMSSTAE